MNAMLCGRFQHDGPHGGNFMKKVIVGYHNGSEDVIEGEYGFEDEKEAWEFACERACEGYYKLLDGEFWDESFVDFIKVV